MWHPATEYENDKTSHNILHQWISVHILNFQVALKQTFLPIYYRMKLGFNKTWRSSDINIKLRDWKTKVDSTSKRYFGLLLKLWNACNCNEMKALTMRSTWGLTGLGGNVTNFVGTSKHAYFVSLALTTAVAVPVTLGHGAKWTEIRKAVNNAGLFLCFSLI